MMLRINPHSGRNLAIDVQLIDNMMALCRVSWYLVRFSSVGKGLPHGDTETPHVTFTGEFVEIYTFWSVPLQRPFTCSTSLRDTE